MDRNEWICSKCYTIDYDNADSVSDDTHDLNESPQFNVTDVDFTKYDNVILTL